MQQLAQQRNGYCQQTPKTGIAEADLPVKVELHVRIIPYGTAEPNVDNPPEQKFDCRYQNCSPQYIFAASGMGRKTNSACSSIKQMPPAGAGEKSVCCGK